MNILKKLIDRKYRNAEMVQYWKTSRAVEAKLIQKPEGHYMMQMRGEKYPFPGWPRQSILYGKLSPLKHWIKNKVFNQIWRMLEEGTPESEIRTYLKEEAWPYVYALTEEARYDMLPDEYLQPAVKEINRAMKKVGVSEIFRKTLCFILEEDDAYRFRFQWLAKFRPTTRESFSKAMDMMEHAEMIGDMKERIRLVKRGVLFMGECVFDRFLQELNWKKVQLSKGDKYFFRAKYFKVDYPEYEY